MNRFLRSRAVTAVASASLAAVVFGGVAAATHDPKTIHACVSKSSGTPRIVSGAGSCRRDESYVDWNKEGPTGAVGAQGPAGATGATGATGAQGLAGPVGPQGEVGAPGATGAQGPVGPQGELGTPGATGPQGTQGIAGPVGPSGPQGLPGPQGLTGATGATGASGPQGATGPQGPAGTNATPVRWAFITNNGSAFGSSGHLQSSSSPTIATYELIWDRDVSQCAAIATTTSRQYASVQSFGNKSTVSLWFDDGTPGGRVSASVAVFCPS